MIDWGPGQSWIVTEEWRAEIAAQSDKICRLRREAAEAAQRRGHKVGNWANMADWTHGTVSHGWCQTCGAKVVVCRDAPPNGIEIAGEAVAVDCTSPRRDPCDACDCCTFDCSQWETSGD